MKITYEEAEEADRGVVAEIFHMIGSPDEVCLNLYKNLDDGNKVVTLYHDGEVVVQNRFNTGSSCIKKLYKGDSVTITF